MSDSNSNDSSDSPNSEGAGSSTPTPTPSPTTPAANTGAGELEAAQAKLAQYEKADLDRKEAQARKAGEWEKVVESKDAQIAKLQGKVAERDKALEGFKAAGAERTILEGIGAQAKGADPKTLRAVYRDLVTSKGLDVAPKDLDAAIKERVGLLSKDFPALFSGEEPRSSKPPAGGGSPQPKGKPKPKRPFNRL